jgi:hypothetical protein
LSILEISQREEAKVRYSTLAFLDIGKSCVGDIALFFVENAVFIDENLPTKDRCT